MADDLYAVMLSRADVDALAAESLSGSASSAWARHDRLVEACRAAAAGLVSGDQQQTPQPPNRDELIEIAAAVMAAGLDTAICPSLNQRRRYAALVIDALTPPPAPVPQPQPAEPAEDEPVPRFLIGEQVVCVEGWRAAGGVVTHCAGDEFTVSFQNEVGVYLDGDGPYDPTRFRPAPLADSGSPEPADDFRIDLARGRRITELIDLLAAEAAKAVAERDATFDRLIARPAPGSGSQEEPSDG